MMLFLFPSASPANEVAHDLEMHFKILFSKLLLTKQRSPSICHGHRDICRNLGMSGCIPPKSSKSPKWQSGKKIEPSNMAAALAGPYFACRLSKRRDVQEKA